MNRDATETSYNGVSLSAYLTGFALALVLTVVPFAAVAFGWLSTGASLAVVAVAAVAQILVHLFFFLHLDISAEHRWNTVSALFSALVMLMLVGGTLWLFYSLHYRTMLGH